MDELGRYYTSGGVSKLLVSCFLQDDPKSVLDIGVGGGALVHAARQRWNQADFYVADIDRKSIAEVSSALPFVKVLKIDGLSGKIDSRDRMTVGNIDVAICNPPYRRTQKTPAVLEDLRKAGLPDCRLLKKITSDIIFLAKNLAMLREGGELGIIVPDTIVSGREFELFRKDLITRHCVFGAIQIPDGVFKKTEARTHILLVRKGGSTPEKVQVRMSDRNGTTGPGLSVSKDALIERMDFTFHQWKSKNCGSQGKMTLGELNVEIKRGRQTKKAAGANGNSILPHQLFSPDSRRRDSLRPRRRRHWHSGQAWRHTGRESGKTVHRQDGRGRIRKPNDHGLRLPPESAR